MQPGSLGAGVAKLPVTARALVAASPTVTHDGAVVVGSRTSTAWALDARTGRVLRTFAPRGAARVRPPAVELGEAAQAAGWQGEDDGSGAFDAAEADDLAGALLLGRTEYTVRSLDAVTGAERWNVTFAELEPLGAAAAPQQQHRAGDGALLSLPPGGTRLVLGAEQTLRSVGPDGACMQRCWIAHASRMLTRGTPQAGSGGRCSWRPQR